MFCILQSMQWLPHLVHPVGGFLSFPWKWSCQHPPLLSFMDLRTCFCWWALQCFLFFSARAELLIWQVSAPFQICLFSSLRIEYSLCLKRSFNLCFSSQKQLPNANATLGIISGPLTCLTCEKNTEISQSQLPNNILAPENRAVCI